MSKPQRILFIIFLVVLAFGLLALTHYYILDDRYATGGIYFLTAICCIVFSGITIKRDLRESKSHHSYDESNVMGEIKQEIEN